MKYGFVIDQRKCIGCHACTVACKSENDVPLGAFRTWVKYVEKGTFPDTRRYFTVMRCQHCEDAPCVEICPTTALFKRNDGIVDFDSNRCIGCKGCMQACPYDALYIDPDSHTAAKCNYCAHRTDRGLLPACVIVCPEKAIVAGDLDDTTSEIARLVAREPVQIRRPEQGTRPQVFYLGADESAITPGIAAQPTSYMWAQTGPVGVALEPKGRSWAGNAAPRPITFDGNGSGSINTGAGSVAAKVAPADGHRGGATNATTVYDVAHPKPWGWRVGTYLWTKAIAAGSLSLAGLIAIFGGAPDILTGITAPILAMLFIAITGGLLVWDLKRPDRFWRLFLTPNLKSWVAIGSFVILAFGIGAFLFLLGGVFPSSGLVRLLAWPAVLLGIAAAGYSAFLFGQAEGRDFWQSPVMFWHLLAGSVLGGAAALLLASFVVGGNSVVVGWLGWALAAGIGSHVLLALGDLVLPHSNKDVAAAAHLVTHGPFQARFWGGVVTVCGVVPLVLLLIPSAVTLPLAAILGLAGLWLYEDTWIQAGQSVPIS